MSLNIKNERVHDLARQAAEVTGKTMTSAIEEALMKLLDGYGVAVVDARRQQRVDMVTQLLTRVDVELARTTPGAIARVDDLYDEAGLPQ